MQGTTATRTYALWKKGASEDIYLRGPGSAIIDCDASQLLESKVSATQVEFLEQGYFTAIDSGNSSRRRRQLQM